MFFIKRDIDFRLLLLNGSERYWKSWEGAIFLLRVSTGVLHIETSKKLVVV
jgi:hypothetical protein